jgi:predicted acylesterase/phospholipase RssA
MVLFFHNSRWVACLAFIPRTAKINSFQIPNYNLNNHVTRLNEGSSTSADITKGENVNGQARIKPISIAKGVGGNTLNDDGTTEVTTLEGLEEYYADVNKQFRKKKTKKLDMGDDIDYDKLIGSLSVKGDTQIIGSPSHPDIVHPVLQLLHERRRKNYTPQGSSSDDDDNSSKMKVALVVEGGGMRGCVTAGMVTAIHYLGLEDTFDVIYGSSAGTVIGSYFNTRQLPFFGPEIYYDSLTTAGKDFIDSKRLLRSIGIGLVDPRLLKDVLTRRNNGKPVLNLDFLLRTTLQKRKPLDWEKFVEMQKKQPIKVVASGLKSEKSFILDMENGAFGNLEELSRCMHASCLIPGIAGPVMNINVDSLSSSSGEKKFALKNNLKHNKNMEPMADALIYNPLPYSSAISENATHVLMLRSIPDGTDVTGKSSIFTRFITKRFFLRKNKLPSAFQHMRKFFHKKVYAKQVIELNEAAKDVERSYDDLSKPHIMTCAIPPGSPGVARLETGRKEIFDGVRRGFARAYDALVEDPNERGRGAIVAAQCLPDEILDYDPTEIDAKKSSAFDYFLKQKEGEIKDGSYGNKLPESLGKTALEAGLPR